MKLLRKNNLRIKAFSVVEVILAIALIAILTLTVSTSLLYGIKSSSSTSLRSRADMLAEEGLEATRNIRDTSFAGLSDGTYGIVLSSNKWTLSGSSDVSGNFTRQITISTVDTTTKQITSKVTWPGTNNQVSYSQYLSDVFRTAYNSKNGVMVYGDGGTTSDAIKYKTFNSTTGVWSTAVSTADVDTTTTNRALRAAQLYASSTRNEKVMISRHHNGTNQYIYAQVFNGTTWANVQLLSSWANSTFLDVQNFYGTYLNNGDFMVVYSDNTTTPKARTWNGTTWSNAFSLRALTGIPVYIVVKNRPNTNEVMAAFFDQAKATTTSYFSGASYATASWSANTVHATNAPVNTLKLVDFTWSLNSTTVGALVYTNALLDNTVEMRIWTANGSGSGSWGTAVSGPVQLSVVGSLSLVSRVGSNEFFVCDKDQNTSPRVYCARTDFTPTYTLPLNQTIVSTTDTGIQRSFDQVFEGKTGNDLINVYSSTVTANIPLYRKYNNALLGWDLLPTNITSLNSSFKSVRTIADSTSDDIMVLMADGSQRLYSIVWNGSSNMMYSTPTGKALLGHGTSGSATTDFWYDFAWDKF